jgi:hypothetical protein
MAVNCLKKNDRNRNLDRERVSLFARTMIEGKWVATHQGIAFDENKNLVDGQHRLAAVVKSGVVVKMQVTSGVPTEMVDEYSLAIDCGRPRRFDDYARFIGNKSRHGSLAVAKIMEYGPKERFPLMQLQTQFELVAKYDDAITFVKKRLTKRKLNSSPIAAVIARAYYTQDHGKIERFITILQTGEYESPEENGPVMLRNFLLEDHNSMVFTPATLYGKTASALNAFVKTRKLGVLKPSQTELFPIPVMAVLGK